MKRYTVCIIVFFILFMALPATYSYGDSINIDNLKNYDFDTPNINGNGTNQGYSSFKGITTLLVYFLFFIIVSFMAYFTVKWVGKHQVKVNIKSKYMEVVDSLFFGSDKGLYIVKTPEGMFILGVTKENITLIERLGENEEELIKAAESNKDTHDKIFSDHLNSYLKKLKSGSTKTSTVKKSEKS
ncbi:flagellar biosynthetic protein FliO [Tepidanaerobacter syntrophicus]|uniref:Flagellar protein FliO/FliZ n=1 Tax=Tepidanaerobacter syntrophicus TaxID=224999 RepID=A0A0U9HPD3_9FIRM|nr:flagellar biosynthetic protein FliO [Tepidanaerobacter syntrophicus]GAQ26243.1 flagellar protein FliO/FliZ [Tepidanaerobacter syntrophicus]GLI19231.1 hypothetical protein TSYNTROPHJE_10440 [Tepidanaerobacter syntrophicus]